MGINIKKISITLVHEIILFYNYNDQKGTPKIFCSHFQKVKFERTVTVMCSQTHRSHCSMLQFPQMCSQTHRSQCTMLQILNYVHFQLCLPDFSRQSIEEVHAWYVSVMADSL